MPISLKLPHTAVYLVSDPDNIATIYKNERIILPASLGHAIILRNIFAVSKPAVEAYKMDNSGSRRYTTLMEFRRAPQSSLPLNVQISNQVDVR